MDNLPSPFIQTQPLDTLELAPKPNQAARLTALSFSPKEICEKLGVSASWLSVTKESPLFKAVVREYQAELDEAAKKAQSVITEALPKAAEKLVEILENKGDKPEISPRLQKEVAVEMLKGERVLKGESSAPQIQINLSDSKMNIILQTIREIKRGD
jgi:hypothetical protein